MKNKIKTDVSTEAVKKKKKFLNANDISGWILILPTLIILLVLVLRPQILGIKWSFHNMNGFEVREFIGLDNYRRVLTNTDFLKAFFNTWKFLICSLLVGLLPPFIIAIVMNEMAFFRKTVRTLVYMPGIMPAVVCSVLWYFMYQPDMTGLLNTILVKFGADPYTWLQDGRFTILYIIISMTWHGMGGTAIYYFANLQGVNTELYEAAMIDGAGFLRRTRTVTIPYMLPMFLLFAVKQCVGIFQIVDQPMQMTGGGPNNASMTLGLLGYNYSFVNYKPQLGLTLNVITFLMIMIFTFFYVKADKKISEHM